MIRKADAPLPTKGVYTRRSLLTHTALTGLAMAMPCALFGEPPSASQAPGVQLYTLRDAMALDMAGTLAKVGALGYREVEFAGYFNQPFKEIRRWLAQAGLTAPSAHVGPESFKHHFEQAVESALALNHRHLFLSWIPPEDRTPAGYRAIAKLLNRNGAIAHAAGLRLGYHHHDFDLHPQQGLRGFDILVRETDPQQVQFELDLYWLSQVKEPVRPLLEQLAGRVSCAHLKDRNRNGNMVDVGEGVIDFSGLYDPLKRAGVKHFYIEHDHSPAPFRTLERSLTFFRKIEIENN